jgi:hypothetical protein
MDEEIIMKLPFSREDFLQVFRDYNTGIYPMQFVFYLLAFIAIFFAIKKTQFSDTIIVMILSFFWLWMGIVYQIVYFSAINPMANLFGAAFILQSLLFLWKGIYQAKLEFAIQKNSYGITGGILIIFSLLIYPLIGYLAGREYPASPTFGLPCPTTIFSFGMLLLLKSKCPVIVLIIPFCWSIIGFSAAFFLDIKEDTSLIISAFVGSILLLRKKNLQ